MKIILTISLIAVLVLSFLLSVWVVSPRLTPTPAKQRLKRSIAAGVAASTLGISIFLLFGIFSSGERMPGFSFTTVQVLCQLLSCFVLLGVIAAVYVYHQVQYSEPVLRNNLDEMSKFFERHQKKVGDKTKES